MKIWLTTDTHFNHKKMIEYCGRPENFEEIIKKELLKINKKSMGVESERRNYLYKWNYKRHLKIPYFFHNKEGKIWGMNIPLICYFVRYYGEITK